MNLDNMHFFLIAVLGVVCVIAFSIWQSGKQDKERLKEKIGYWKGLLDKEQRKKDRTWNLLEEERKCTQIYRRLVPSLIKSEEHPVLVWARWFSNGKVITAYVYKPNGEKLRDVLMLSGYPPDESVIIEYQHMNGWKAATVIPEIKFEEIDLTK